jgi:hypothetical protein
VTHSSSNGLKSWNNTFFFKDLLRKRSVKGNVVLRWCSSAKHLGLSSPRPGFKSPAEHDFYPFKTFLWIFRVLSLILILELSDTKLLMELL